jgi:polyphosphate glucokinase
MRRMVMGDADGGPRTLAVDVGGTGVKASVLDGTGSMVCDRDRVKTRYPFPPEALVAEILGLANRLGEFERASVGFPGMVRDGKILTAPKFVKETGAGSAVDKGLLKKWSGFPLAERLTDVLQVPVKVANDADVQGAAVISGVGYEMVITLGTGFGTAFFNNGVLLPHMEFSHHPFRKNQTYDEQLGELARRLVGDERWERRVSKAVVTLRDLCFFDHCYIGGGNAKRIQVELDDDVSIVSNLAGILGGVVLWR